MNRRDMLKTISALLPAAVVPFLPGLEFCAEPAQTADDFVYEGWRVVWFDWCHLANMDIMVCKWAAYSTRPTDWHLVSCWPGTCGSFLSGQVLNLTRQDYQALPTFQSTPKELAFYRAACLKRLQDLISKAGPPPLVGPVYLG